MGTRVGRGRSRGGRILDVTTTPPPRGLGRSTLGRGLSPSETSQLKGSCPDQFIPAENSPPCTGEIEARMNLEGELETLVQTNKGSVIHLTLKYFDCSSDTQFYVDQVMDYLLRSPSFIEKFTMGLKLITLIETHGEDIKRKLFIKLQTTFQDMRLIMDEECGSLNKTERDRVRNFCDLIMQLYFRLRVAVDSLERYEFLSNPVLQCMAYLLKTKGRQELKLFVKMIALNLTALMGMKSKICELKAGVRQALYDGVEDCKEQAWLMCALEALNAETWEMDTDAAQFYEQVLQQDWADIPTTRVQMLADIPPDIVDSQMIKFNVNVEDYIKYRYVAL